jgi:hypothetical protein
MDNDMLDELGDRQALQVGRVAHGLATHGPTRSAMSMAARE